MTDQSHISHTTVFPVELKKTANTNGGEYHGPCPFCGGEDRFYVHPAKQLWRCRQCERGGDYIEFVKQYDGIDYKAACEKLGITPDALPPTQQAALRKQPAKKLDLQAAPIVEDIQRIDVPTTKREYDGLTDYAYAHGVTTDVLVKAGWQEVTHGGRSALSFPTANGTRWRFVDGNEPRYINTEGFTRCWYGLDRAIILATELDKPMVMVNGEISAIAGQEHSIPAFTMAGGGENKIPPALLKELNDKWSGDVVLAFENDDAGNHAAKAIAEQLEDRAITVDLGLSGSGDVADLCYIRPSNAALHLWQRVEAKRLKPRSDAIVSSTTALERYDIRLRNLDTTIEGVPIEMPFDRLRTFGGFASVLMPNKLYGVIAPSGSGKTSFLGTLNDALNAAGHSGFWYGPEWTADESIDIRIQRNGGLSTQRMMEWELYKVNRRLGKPTNESHKISQAEFEQSQAILNTVRNWPGVTEFFPPRTSLTDTLAQMRDMLTMYRERGQMVTYAIFDYIQLLRADDVAIDGDNRHEVATELVKSFCMQNNIVGVVASQVTKSSTQRNKDANDKLDGSNMLFVRDDKMNLVLTLNVEYDDDIDDRGVVVGRRPTPRGTIVVSKNNLGAKGQLQCIADWPRLRWIVDKDWSALTR